MVPVPVCVCVCVCVYVCVCVRARVCVHVCLWVISNQGTSKDHAICVKSFMNLTP